MNLLTHLINFIDNVIEWKEVERKCKIFWRNFGEKTSDSIREPSYYN